MKLTNDMKAAFIRSVMEALPVKTTFDLTKLTEAIEARAMDLLPKEVLKLHRKHPEMLLMTHKSRQIFARNASDNPFPSQSHYLSFNYPAMVPVESIKYDDLLALYVEHLKELNDRDELRCRLQQVLKSPKITSTNRLLEALPELAEFVPKDPGKVNYPVVAVADVVKDLLSAGLVVKEEAHV